MVGNYSYLAQEMREAGFRSYIREHQPDFSIVDTVATAELEDDVRHAVERLLARHRDLVGLYVACGGFEGALEALRRKGRIGEIALICNELIPASREALIDRAGDHGHRDAGGGTGATADRRSRSRRRCKRRRALQARAHPFRPVRLRERLKPRG